MGGFCWGDYAVFDDRAGGGAGALRLLLLLLLLHLLRSNTLGVDGGVEQIRDDEAAAEGGVVAEEVVAEIYEAFFDVEAVEVLGGGAVGDEFPEVLGEAAAEVEEGLGARGGVGRGLRVAAEAGEDFRVERVPA